MPISPGADAGSAVVIRRDVVDNVVRALRVAAHAINSLELIEGRGSSALATRSCGLRTRYLRSLRHHQQNAAFVVQSQSAAENIDAANLFAHHRIGQCSVLN